MFLGVLFLGVLCGRCLLPFGLRRAGVHIGTSYLLRGVVTVFSNHESQLTEIARS